MSEVSLQEGDLNMQDLELLHHFATETCSTTSNQKESHQIWRVTVPKEAFVHDFLMRGLLATSALHLSHLRPNDAEYYRHVAHAHQDKALSSFQAIMPNISQANCHASFAFSSLIVVYAFASPRSARSLAFTDQTQESAEWLPLIRGVNSILQTVWPYVENGPLRGLLQPGMHQALETRLPKVINSQLNQLVELCQRSNRGEDAVAAYKLAAQALRNCYAKIFTRSSVECEIATAFTWPVAVPEEFIRLLNMRTPEALVILAHYCVVLHHLDDYWWLRGWAAHLVHNIYAEIDEPWRVWIQWPSDVIDRNEKCLMWRPMTPEAILDQNLRSAQSN
ncbi:MAG: hypothetical protein Q9190_005433 [Brigantiaea leucoxantha]